MTQKDRLVAPLLALFAGAIHALSMVPTLPGWLAPLALVALLAALARAASTRHAALLGWLYGLVAHLAVFHWLFAIPETPAAVLAVAYAVLALVFALIPAALCALYQRTGQRLPQAARLVFFPIFWVGMEQLRGMGLLGFPWLDLSSALAAFPLLIQPAAWAGAAGVDLIAAILATTMAATLDRRQGLNPPQRLATALAALVIAFIWPLAGYLRLQQAEAGEGLRVAVVQGNIDPTQKWQSGRARMSLDTFSAASREVVSAAAPDLVVWPETSIPCLLEGETPTVCGLWIQDLARSLDTTLLVGALSPGPPSVGRNFYFNSAYLIDSEGSYVDRYDKVRLVPFGEMIPLDDIIEVLRRVDLGEGDFVAGEAIRPIGASPLRLGVAICFESLFGSVSRALARDGADLLVIITNDAWFGGTSAPAQHATIAALRAVETGLAVARCANTGISGFIDPWGRYLDSAPMDTRATLIADLPTGPATTPYVRFGDTVGFPCALWTAAFALGELLALRRKK